MTEQQQNFALLSYIAFFGFLCAVLIARRGALGWALTAKNAAYAVVFYLAVAVVFWPWLRDAHLWDAARLGLAVALTWATAELIIAWWHRRGPWTVKTTLGVLAVISAALFSILAVLADMGRLPG